MTHTAALQHFASRVRQFIAASAQAGHAHAQSRNKIKAVDFDSLALELFALQFELCAAYRTLCKARGVRPGNVEHWTRIPAVPTAAFKEMEVSCLSPAERATVFYSSGTTTQGPSRHFHSTDSLGLYGASLLPWFEGHLLEGWPGGPIVSLTPPGRLAPNSSLVHMFEIVTKQFGGGKSTFTGSVRDDGAWGIDIERTRQILRQTQGARQPALLLGTAFQFVHLLDHMLQQKESIKLPPGSRLLETGGYKGRSRILAKEGLHRLITQVLGVPATHIVCEYGMSELSSQAYDQVATRRFSERRLFRFPPWARTRIVSPENGSQAQDGQTGLLQVFDLANVFSVMAIQTEDLGIAQGDGFELLGRAALAEPRGCSLMASP